MGLRKDFEDLRHAEITPKKVLGAVALCALVAAGVLADTKWGPDRSEQPPDVVEIEPTTEATDNH